MPNVYQLIVGLYRNSMNLDFSRDKLNVTINTDNAIESNKLAVIIFIIGLILFDYKFMN